MQVTDPWMTALFVLATISGSCTLLVLLHLQFFIRSEQKNLQIKLLSFLHFTLFLEDLSNLPVAYSGNLGLCQFIGWLRFYSGLANMFVIFLLGCYYFSFLSFQSLSSDLITNLLEKYSLVIIFIFPFITLLPFTTNSYGIQDEDWCTLPTTNDTSNYWSLGIYYIWIFLLLLFVCLQYIYSLWIIIQAKAEMMARLFHSIGIYIIISMFCWIPRIILRSAHFFVNFKSSSRVLIETTLPLYISGICYAVVYFWDMFVRKESRFLQRTDLDDRKRSTILVSDLLTILDVGGNRTSRAISNRTSRVVSNPMADFGNLAIERSDPEYPI